MSGVEVLAVTASVDQLVAVVYSISKTLYEVGNALSNVPLDINDLSHDFETLSEELKSLYALLDTSNARCVDHVYTLIANAMGRVLRYAGKLTGFFESWGGKIL